MKKFKEIKTGNIWYISNKEHIKHFLNNPRFEEVVEKSKKESKKSKESKITEEVVEETTE